MRHIAVIGAGIIGAALADRLTEAGAEVTLIDARLPGSATSGTSLAWLNANQKLPRHYHDLSVCALDQWRELTRGFGQPDWYAPTGSLTWAESDCDRHALTERLARLREWGYPVVELTPRQALDVEPSLRVPDTAMVAYFPAEGFVHGGPAVEALVARAQTRGARTIVTDDEVSLEADGSTVAAVRLPDGGRLRVDAYVCCAGWRTPRLLEPLGVTVPLVPGEVPGSTAPCLVTRTDGPSPVSRVIHAPDLSLRPAPDGGLQLEAEDLNTLIDARTPQEDLDRYGNELVRRAGHHVPGAGGSPARNLVCIRPLPVDGHPIVGWLPGLANAYVAVTHSGMTLAALLARYAAAEILQGTDNSELTPYRPTRFA